MLNVYYFTTAGWGGTGDLTAPVEQNTLWGTALVRRGLTLDQCYNACNPTADDPVVISPDPDSAEFRDAAGFRKHTVTVPLGANLTINKSITLAGGAYRLRLDGEGTSGVTINAASSFFDVDFVRLYSSGYPLGATAGYSATRCLFAGFSSAKPALYNPMQIPQSDGAFTDFTDCAAFANGLSYRDLASASGKCRATRCSFRMSSGYEQSGCVNIRDLTHEQLNTAFISPPKIYDVDNPGYYTDGTAWTKDDWESVDLRLLSTSEYATGNALTSADGVVYDLAGNKRKIGGAKGAFEVLDDVTHDSREQIPGWRYSVEKDADDAPDVVSAAVIENALSSPYKRHTVVLFGEETVAYRINNEWVTKQKEADVYDAGFNIPTEWRATNAAGTTTIRIFTTPENGDRECAPTFKESFFWYSANTTSTSTPTAASVVYVLHSGRFASTASTVGEIIVPGWTHVDVGDVTAKIKPGLGATVRSSGKLTLENETTTSAELLRRVQLRAPALLTLKDCNVSD